VTADVSGRDAVVAWNIDHRSRSPYQLRHNETNVHPVASDEDVCSFRSHIFVTQIVGGGVVPLASGICVGAARTVQGRLRHSDLRLMLEYTDSQVFSAATRFAFD